MTSSVLYDAPGPVARRLTRAVSAVAGVAIAAATYWLVVRPLAAHGQFAQARWAPLADPRDPDFDLLWRRLGAGVGATLTAAVLAILTSLVGGTVLALVRVGLQDLRRRRFAGLPAPLRFGLRALARLLDTATRACVEVLRGLPVVITIFFVGRGLPEYGLSLDNALWYVVVGLTVYNMVVIGEILRAGMAGLPSGQREAAAAVGLSGMQTARLVLLPQAFRIMLPALTSQLVVILKDTSLGFIVSYEELLDVAKQAAQVLGNPIQLYAVVAAVYIAVNYALSTLAVRLQRRVASGRRRLAVAGAAAPGPRAAG